MAKKFALSVITLFIILNIIAFGGLALSYNYEQANHKNQLQAERGVIDLKNFDFEQNSLVSLRGEWEFYWNELLTPEELTGLKTENYIQIPAGWKGYNLADYGKLPGEGYATFRFIIKTGDNLPALALKLNGAGTAYKLWINGKPVSENGVVAKDKKNFRPEARPDVVSFENNKNNSVELVIQAANFAHRDGGLWTDIKLGKESFVRKTREMNLGESLFFCGTLLFMSLYHLTLYITRPKDKAIFFCAILAFLIAARAMAMGEIPFLLFMPGLSWYTIYSIQYLAFYLAVPTLFQFVKLLYPSCLPAKFTKFCWLIGAIFTATVILFKSNIYTQFILVYEIFTLATFLYTLAAIFFMIIRTRRKEDIFFFLGFFIIFLGAAHDVLVVNYIFHNSYMMEEALFIFMLFQTCFLAMRYTNAFKIIENLSEELEEYSHDLEEKVRLKTHDINLAKEEADAANRAKSEFLAIVSHEIRTPMNCIIGMNELLFKTPLTDEQKEYAGIILESSEQLMLVLGDVLDFSKIEKGELILEEIGFDIYEQARLMQGMIEPLAVKKGLVFASEIDGNMPRVLKGDLLRLRQILLNLLNNSLKFTEHGAIYLKICLCPESRFDLPAPDEKQVKLHFEVEDTGIGIDPVAIGQIFEPFSQGDASATRKYGGTGLGLSICKRLTEAMGGKISVESILGKGSCFKFTLPFTLTDQEIILEKKSESSFAGVFDDKTPVLIVDDFEFNRKTLILQLRKLGLSCETASDGKEALKMTKEREYALILLDLNMPDIDGYETARQMRNLGVNTPIIAFTANVLPDEDSKILAAGMNGFLKKPLTLEELGEMLKNYLPYSNISTSTRALKEQSFAWPEFLGEAGLETLKKSTGNDFNFMLELVSDFINLMPQKLADLEKAFATGDYKTAGIKAHSMRSGAAFIGADKLNNLLRELEKELMYPLNHEIKEKILEINKEYMALEQNMRSFANRFH